MNACGETALYTTRFALMGGGASVEFVAGGGRPRAEKIARDVEAEARRIETKFSRYRESSVISEINRNAGRTPVAVDEETDALVGEALALARDTEGRFDPTVGPLRRAWDFKGGRVPGDEEIDALLPLVGADRVSRRNRTIFLRREGMEIDLGGVGKEYAVDRAADILRREGIAAAIVNFAGDVRILGSRADGRRGRSACGTPGGRERSGSPSASSEGRESRRPETTNGASCGTASGITTSSTRPPAGRRAASPPRPWSPPRPSRPAASPLPRSFSAPRKASPCSIRPVASRAP
jgi:thiamine biosynthesis lipoprotein